MPLLVVAAGVGALAGFVLGRGVEGASNLVKWGALAGGGFLLARHFKVL